MAVLDAVRQYRALKADADRWAVAGERFAKHLENTLGPARMRALRSDACKDVRGCYIAATTQFVRAMNECDGSPESVTRVNRASIEYLTAYRDVFEVADELAT